MTNRQLVTFFLAQRAQGLSVEQIRSAAIGSGWDTEDLAAAEIEATRLMTTSVAPSAPKQRHRLSPADALLFLGGLIVLAGAVLLIAPSWADWNIFWRILTVVVPTAVLLFTGDHIWSNQKNSHPAFLFLLVGGLLLPVTFGVIVFELAGALDNPAPLFLLTSLLTGGAYVIAAGRYRHLVWTTLACLATVAMFFSTVAWFEITEPRAWLWLGVLYGIIVFGAGLLLEKNKKIFEARSPYFFGAGAFIIGLGSLGLSGLLLQANMYDYYDSAKQAVAQSGSIVIVGVIFLLVSLLGRYWQQQKWLEAGRYTRVWDFFGALGICLAPLLLGFDESYKNISFVALAVAIGVMGAAVRWQQRFWFYAAAVTLVIVLIRIGAGLFSDSALWPIMLLVVGPLVMGAGYTLLKLQSRLFKKTPPPHQSLI